MKKAFLLSYSNDFDRFEMVDYLDKIDEVVDWRFDMSNSFYFISTLNAAQLSTKLFKISSGKGRFIIAELSGDNFNGALPKEAWDFINRKLTVN